MTPLLSIAPQIRAHYLDGLLQFLSRGRVNHKACATELLMEVGRDSARALRLFRADLVHSDDGSPAMLEFNSPTHLSFEPGGWVESGIEFELSPITWNGVDIDLEASNHQALVQIVEAWAMAWLDVEDAHPLDDRGLQGVIHSVTEPAQAGISFSFSVDFGSAPVQALAQLLTSLKEAGVARIALSSSSIEEAKG